MYTLLSMYKFVWNLNEIYKQTRFCVCRKTSVVLQEMLPVCLMQLFIFETDEFF